MKYGFTAVAALAAALTLAPMTQASAADWHHGGWGGHGGWGRGDWHHGGYGHGGGGLLFGLGAVAGAAVTLAAAPFEIVGAAIAPPPPPVYAAPAPAYYGYPGYYRYPPPQRVVYAYPGYY